jgi:Family of unknown function (DUF6270)
LALRILIVGSCVSRDAMRYVAPPEAAPLVDYFARCSLASLASAPLRRPVDLDRLASPFQQRMVRRDHSKALLGQLGRLEYDLLLLDLIDERFDVHVGPDGGFTLTSEMRRVDPRATRWPGQTLKSGSDEFMALWRTGWERLRDALRSTGRLSRVRLNAVRWAERTASGGDFGAAHPSAQIATANAMLTAMYEVIAGDLAPEQVLRFDDTTLLGADQHRWGCSPFHYVDTYYLELLRRLGVPAALPTATAAD